MRTRGVARPAATPSLANASFSEEAALALKPAPRRRPPGFRQKGWHPRRESGSFPHGRLARGTRRRNRLRPSSPAFPTEAAAAAPRPAHRAARDRRAPPRRRAPQPGCVRRRARPPFLPADTGISVRVSGAAAGLATPHARDLARLRPVRAAARRLRLSAHMATPALSIWCRPGRRGRGRSRSPASS